MPELQIEVVDSRSLRSSMLLLPQPRGFCAGVIRAIDIVKLALQRVGAPVYVLKEIVHNPHVVAELSGMGAVAVQTIEQVPVGAVVIFSAHGVSPAVRREAARRRLRVIDATCPLVTKVHLEVIRYARAHYTIVLIGHRDHDEIIGTVGEAPDAIRVIESVEEADALEVPDPKRLVYLTQTTLSVDDTQEIVARLKERFPAIISPADEDICYATQNRQTTVKSIARLADVILVVGARNSSNSNRLVEVAERAGTPAHLIDSVADIRPEWLAGCTRIGITAGASTPEPLVERVVSVLRMRVGASVEEIRVLKENVHFSLPRLLGDAVPAVSSNVTGA